MLVSLDNLVSPFRLEFLAAWSVPRPIIEKMPFYLKFYTIFVQSYKINKDHDSPPFMIPSYIGRELKPEEFSRKVDRTLRFSAPHNDSINGHTLSKKFVSLENENNVAMIRKMLPEFAREIPNWPQNPESVEVFSFCEFNTGLYWCWRKLKVIMNIYKNNVGLPGGGENAPVRDPVSFFPLSYDSEFIRCVLKNVKVLKAHPGMRFTCAQLLVYLDLMPVLESIDVYLVSNFDAFHIREKFSNLKYLRLRDVKCFNRVRDLIVSAENLISLEIFYGLLTNSGSVYLPSCKLPDSLENFGLVYVSASFEEINAFLYEEFTHKTKKRVVIIAGEQGSYKKIYVDQVHVLPIEHENIFARDKEKNMLVISTDDIFCLPLISLLRWRSST